MKNCSFFGHFHVYDVDLRRSLSDTLQQVIAQDDEINFIFSRISSPFEILCFEAVLEIKTQFPSKKIYIIKAFDHREEKDNQEFEEEKGKIDAGWPLCVFDRMIQINTGLKAPQKDFLLSAKRVKQWIALNSDILICYEYCDAKLLKICQDKNSVVYDLTNQETKNFFLEHIAKLSEKEQYVIQQRMEKISYLEIGRTLNCTGQAVRYIAVSGYKKLSWMGAARMNAQAEKPISPCICGITNFEITSQAGKQVKQILMVLLASRQGADVVLSVLEPDASLHQFIEQLKKDVLFTGLRFRVVTLYDQAAAHWYDDSGTDYIASPYTQVVTLRSKSMAASDLKETVDFLICDVNTDTESIRSAYLSPNRHLKIFTIGRLPPKLMQSSYTAKMQKRGFIAPK